MVNHILLPHNHFLFLVIIFVVIVFLIDLFRVGGVTAVRVVGMVYIVVNQLES